MSVTNRVDFDLGRFSDQVLEDMIEASHQARDPNSKLVLALRSALIQEKGLRNRRGRLASAITFTLPALNSVEIAQALGDVTDSMAEFDRKASDLRDVYLFCASLKTALKSQADAMSTADTAPAN